MLNLTSRGSFEEATDTSNANQKCTIFLDIDGVLNVNGRLNLEKLEKKYFELYGVKEKFSRHSEKFTIVQSYLFDEKALKNLDGMIDELEKKEFEVEIVISSTWRTFGKVAFCCLINIIPH